MERGGGGESNTQGDGYCTVQAGASSISGPLYVSQVDLLITQLQATKDALDPLALYGKSQTKPCQILLV